MKNYEVLIVTDEDETRCETRAILEGEGFRVTVARDAEAAYALVMDQGLGFDVVLMENGLGLLEHEPLRLHADRVNMPVVCVIAEGEPLFRRPGCDASMPKPIDRRKLLDAIHYAQAHRRVP